MVVYIRKVKKSESKSQPIFFGTSSYSGLCISVKLKNLKANHNRCVSVHIPLQLCISVKLKNLKANHNTFASGSNKC